MQSSRRKRERNDSALSRRSSSRPSSSQKQLNNSTQTPSPTKNNNEKSSKSNNNSQHGDPLSTAQQSSEKKEKIKTSHTSTSVGVGSNESRIGESSEPKISTINVAQHEEAKPIVPISASNTSVAVSERHLSSLISHRHLLLRRIRQSKAAAQTRLGIQISSKADTKATGNIAGGGFPAANTKGVDAEVEAFREMTKVALQANKKQRQDDKADSTNSEKRTSVSLRRGSSVGKKMNAALSSLSSGSNTATPSPVALDPPRSAVQQKQPQKTQHTNNVNAVPVPPIPPPITISGQIATKKQRINSTQAHATKVVGQTKIENTTKARKTSISKQQLQHQHSDIPSQIRVGPQSLQNSQFNQYYSGNRRPMPPPVICPEAISLRKRKAKLLSKLNAILPPSSTKHRNQAVGANIALPQRRRTHWDVLLEEMKWMASDFIEERKWKSSTGRVLASAIKTNNLKMSQPQEDEEEQIEAPPDQNLDSPLKNGKETQELSTQEETDSVDDFDGMDGPGLFTSITDDEIKIAKNQGRVISHMVEGIWCGIFEKGSIYDATKSHRQALEGHVEFRTSLKLTNGNEPIKNGSGSEPKKKGENALLGACEPPQHFQKSHKLVSERISLFVEKFGKKAREKKETDALPKGIVLTVEERKAFDFLQFIWSNGDSGGGILDYSEYTGTDGIIAALLSKNKNTGPHLVLCPPEKLMIWNHEIKKLGGRAIIYGEKPGISVPKISLSDSNGALHLGQGDIVIAEFSSLVDDNFNELYKIRTIILDAWVPLSLWRRQSDASVQKSIARELRDAGWWNHLLAFVSRCKSCRRILLSALGSLCESAGSNEMRSFTQKDRLDLTACYAAYVFGPEIFFSKSKSPAHRILSWAKRRAKSINSGNEPSLKQIEQFLSSSLEDFRYQPEGNDLFADKSTLKNISTKFEVHLCPLPQEQEREYNHVCRAVRGALSLRGGFLNAAKGLMELRKVCFHGNFQKFANIARRRCSSGMTKSSMSQPDVSFASDILQGSAKLLHLVLFLRFQYGINSPTLNSLELKPPESFDASLRATPAWISILVGSCHVKYIVSSLLVALGIDHIVLKSGLDCEKNDVQSGKESWACNQLQASRLSPRAGYPLHAESPPKSNCIVLSCPNECEEEMNRIFVETSDVVMLLDEDWSGRQEEAISNYLKKCLLWRARHSREEEAVRVIRLVPHKTCEEKFIAETEKENGATVDDREWLLTDAGYLTTSSRKHHKSKLGQNPVLKCMFRFPASNILAQQKRLLTGVLQSAAELHPMLETGGRHYFLPFQHETEQSSASFVDTLLAEEMNWDEQIFPVEYAGQLSGTVSRADLSVLPVRHFMGRNGRFWSKEGVLCGHDTSQLASKSSPIASSFSASDNNDGESMEILKFVERRRQHETEPRSLLFYASRKKEDNDMDSLQNNKVGGSSGKAQQLLYNAYDGAQFSEPSIYFPPFFPRPREALHQTAPVATTPQEKHHGPESPPIKRREPFGRDFFDDVNASAKRPRIQDINLEDLEKHGALTHEMHQVHSIPPTFDNPNGHHLNRTITFPPQDSQRLQVVPSDGRYTRPVAMEPGQLFFTSVDAADVPVNVNETTLDNPANLLQFGSIACDNEEAEDEPSRQGDRHLLNAVILFVQKQTNRLYSSSHGGGAMDFQSGHSPWFGQRGLSHSMVNGTASEKGNGPPRKPRKKSIVHGAGLPPHPIPQGNLHDIGARPGMTNSVNQLVVSRDAVRHRMLDSFRRVGFGGISMIESANFRLAFARIKDRISNRIAFKIQQQRSGGVPHIIQAPLANARGERSIDAGNASIVTRRPSRADIPKFDVVDFGPFQIGSVPSVRRFSAVAYPKSKNGVLLPMGVKLPQTRYGEVPLPWTPREDDNLASLVVQHRMNWNLISRHLNGRGLAGLSFERIPTRSSRNCRHRYEEMVREKPDLLEKYRVLDLGDEKEDKKQLESVARVNRSDSGAQDLVPSCLGKNTQAESNLVFSRKDRTSRNALPKHPFSNVHRSWNRRQDFPISIPGVVAGQKPSVVPAHPSHVQSVQAAASSAPGGRAEMWPLQILDLAEKQRSKQGIAKRTPSSSHPSTSRPQGRSSYTSTAPPPSRSSHGKSRQLPQPPSTAAAANPNPTRQTSTSGSQNFPNSQIKAPPRQGTAP